MDDVDTIKNKYGISTAGAAIILEAAMHNEEIPMSTIASIYKYLTENGNKYVTLAMMVNAIRAYIVTKASNSRRVGTKDDHRTNVLKRSSFDEKGNIQLNKQGKREGNNTRYVNMRKLLHDDVYKESRVQTIEPPKYYYVDLDNTFLQSGHDQSPLYDAQFRGFHDAIPYIRSTEDRTSSSSRYKLPVVENGAIIGYEKRAGYKIVNLDIFFNGVTRRIPLKIPYENLPGFDSTVGRDTILTEVSKILNAMMTPEVKKIYDMIKNDKTDMRIIDHLANTTDINKKIASDKKFKDYYGEDYKEERKRKSKKLSLKRKLNNKPTKKLIKKCVCIPPQKRKVDIIKKKVVRRAKK